MTHGVKRCRIHGTTYERCRCIGPHEDVLVECRPEVCGPKVLEQAAAGQTAPESPADLLRRAADRLDALDKAAIAPPWASGDPDGQVITALHRGARLDIGRAAEEDVALIVALRRAAPWIVTWLRGEAEHTEHVTNGHSIEAIEAARAVLGETDGGEQRG